MFPKKEIDIEFDAASQDYYAIWEVIFIGTGETRHEALEDLRAAAHFAVDTLIDLQLKGIGIRKEN